MCNFSSSLGVILMLTIEESIDETKELDEFIREQMKFFKHIAMRVKDYFDTFLLEAGMEDLDSVDKSFYYAFILEISRSIFINWSVHKRRKLNQNVH